MSDWKRIMAEVRLARRGGREISDAAARMIGAMYHEGALSVSFSSTGAVPQNADALWSELFPDWERLNRDERTAASLMLTYLVKHAGRGPVEGWSDLWIREGER